MAHSLACPQCRTKLLAPSEVFGQEVRCTKCGTTFTASPVHSPYLEGLPRPPKDRRPLILGSAVLGGFLVITGLIVGINWINEESAKETGRMSNAGETMKAFEQERLAVKMPGDPIEIPDATGPDQVPPPGQGLPPVLQKALGKDVKPAPAKKATNPLDDVALTFVQWSVSPGVRLLQIGYAFQNGATPAGKSYVLKLRFNNGPPVDVPVSPTLDATGIMEFRPEATISEGTAGRQAKVEAWIELTTGAVSLKVSNTVSTE